MDNFDSVLSRGGEVRTVETGSRRDSRKGRGRFDLIPPYFLRRLAKHYENGAAKYGDNNWKKGQPLRWYIDSAFSHLVAIMEGRDDEDHETAAIWNLISFMWTKQMISQGKLPPELDDMSRDEPI